MKLLTLTARMEIETLGQLLHVLLVMSRKITKILLWVFLFP